MRFKEKTFFKFSRFVSTILWSQITKIEYWKFTFFFNIFVIFVSIVFGCSIIEQNLTNKHFKVDFITWKIYFKLKLKIKKISKLQNVF